MVQFRFLHRFMSPRIDLGNLFVVYQPRVDCATSQVVGFEALVRLQNKDGSISTPDRFIPQAERNRQIIDLGARVLELVAQDYSGWGEASPRISVNVSALQLVPGLSALVKQLLEKHQLEPSKLELEITETCKPENRKLTRQTLSEIRKLGVLIALDDFGTGYSDMNRANCYNFDTLKIDRSLLLSAVNLASVRDSLKQLKRWTEARGITYVVEGVECLTQLRLVRSIGFHEIQGFLFGRPMPLKDACRLLGSCTQRF